MGRKCSLCHEYAITDEYAKFACKAGHKEHIVCVDCARASKWNLKRPGFFDRYQCPCEATPPPPVPLWLRDYAAQTAK